MVYRLTCTFSNSGISDLFLLVVAVFCFVLVYVCTFVVVSLLFNLISAYLFFLHIFFFLLYFVFISTFMFSSIKTLIGNHNMPSTSRIVFDIFHIVPLSLGRHWHSFENSFVKSLQKKTHYFIQNWNVKHNSLHTHGKNWAGKGDISFMDNKIYVETTQQTKQQQKNNRIKLKLFFRLNGAKIGWNERKCHKQVTLFLFVKFCRRNKNNLK